MVRLGARPSPRHHLAPGSVGVPPAIAHVQARCPPGSVGSVPLKDTAGFFYLSVLPTHGLCPSSRKNDSVAERGDDGFTYRLRTPVTRFWGHGTTRNAPYIAYREETSSILKVNSCSEAQRLGRSTLGGVGGRRRSLPHVQTDAVGHPPPRFVRCSRETVQGGKRTALPQAKR